MLRDKLETCIPVLFSSDCYLHFVIISKTKLKSKSKKFGFIAYGSGSKSKVFEAQIEENWKSVIEKVQLFETLDKVHEIDFGTYISLHKKERKQSVLQPKNEFVLDSIEKENPVLVGARYYKFV